MHDDATTEAPATPPSTEAVARALGRLPQAASRRAAALHLALPVGEVPGIAVRRAEGRLRYRGVVVAESTDAVADAVAVVAAGHTGDDTYLELDGEPLGWLKLVRSGNRRVLFGTDVLFGAPLVSIEDGVPASVATEMFRRHLAGELAGPPVVDFVGGVSVLVDGIAASWVLRLGSGGEVEEAEHDRPPVEHPEEFASVLAAEMGAGAVEVVELGSRSVGTTDVEYLLSLESGWQVIVPVTLTPTTELVGVEPGSIGVAPAAELPPGYRWLGRSVWEDAMVAEHLASGYVVMLRRSAA